MNTQVKPNGSGLQMTNGVMPHHEEMEFDSARAVAQIQGAMAIAKRFPRDENAALNRINASATRKKLAEQAEYEYSKGGSNVSGPSIRAAEAIAQAWGNMISGITEVARDSDKKESLMLAYAADMETNNWKFLEFRVPHTLDTRDGAKQLKSGRDIYERTMNDGARRLRNCLLAVIPGDVVDTFLDKCNETLSKSDVPLRERIGSMIKSMADLSITQAMIENKMGCNAGALTERQLAQLRRIFQSIKDGFGKPEDYFTKSAADKTDKFKQNMGAEPARQETETVVEQEPDQPPVEPGSFQDFSATNLFEQPAPPPREKSKPEIVSAIFAAAEAKGIEVGGINEICQTQFKKTPSELDLPQLKELLGAIESAAQAGAQKAKGNKKK